MSVSFGLFTEGARYRCVQRLQPLLPQPYEAFRADGVIAACEPVEVAEVVAADGALLVLLVLARCAATHSHKLEK